MPIRRGGTCHYSLTVNMVLAFRHQPHTIIQVVTVFKSISRYLIQVLGDATL